MKRLILFVAVLGLSFFAYGAYIPAKAVLAQYLINDAWNDSMAVYEKRTPEYPMELEYIYEASCMMTLDSHARKM